MFCLFFHDGSCLTWDKLVVAVYWALEQVGVDVSSYAEHSFRIGAAWAENLVIKMPGQ